MREHDGISPVRIKRANISRYESSWKDSSRRSAGSQSKKLHVGVFDKRRVRKRYVHGFSEPDRGCALTIRLKGSQSMLGINTWHSEWNERYVL